MVVKKEWSSIVPGLLAAIAISVLAIFISRIFPQPGAICLSILFGMLLGNVLPEKTVLSPGLGFAEKKLLPWAIALMGTELELQALGQMGGSAVLCVFPPMLLVLLLARPLGKLLGVSEPAAMLLGVGNSVCGSSAVLAAAPVLPVDKHDTPIAIAAVNLMGIIGMFLLPLLAAGVGLSGEDTAKLLGGSLQAVGQVAASGFSISTAVGDHALVVKMLRVLMIGPIVMVLSHLFHKKAESESRRFPHVPGYIFGFMGCALVAAFLPEGNFVVPAVRALAVRLMGVAMVAIGSRIRFRSLMSQGPRVLVLVGLLSLLQSGAVLLFLIAY